MTAAQASLFDQGDRYRRVQDAQVGYHGSNPSDTELGAALKQVSKSGEKKRRVMLALAAAGLTDHELVDLLGLPMSSINSTRNMLVRSGHVEDSGERRGSPFDNPCIVWVATDKGKVAAQSLRSAS